MDFIKEYWAQITFALSIITALVIFIKAMIEAVKCLLRNDILAIYDRCKESKSITKWQLDAIEHSYTLYKKLKGNSFVENIVNIVRSFKIVD